MKKARKAAEELGKIEQECLKKFPLDEKAATAVLEEMRDRISALHAGESKALENLARAVK